MFCSPYFCSNGDGMMGIYGYPLQCHFHKKHGLIKGLLSSRSLVLDMAISKNERILKLWNEYLGGISPYLAWYPEGF